MALVVEDLSIPAGLGLCVAAELRRDPRCAFAACRWDPETLRVAAARGPARPLVAAAAAVLAAEVAGLENAFAEALSRWSATPSGTRAPAPPASPRRGPSASR